MKNFRRVVISLGVFYALGLALLLWLTLAGSSERTKETTIVQLNDIAKEAAKNLDAPESLRTKDFGTSYVILNRSNEIVYDSRTGRNTFPETERLSAETAIKENYPYTYITRDDRILGLVILPDKEQSFYVHGRRRLLAGFGVISLVLFLGAVFFYVYVKRNIITPFHKMEAFAGKVAQGNLDEPLVYDKNNLFGVFSESFDIMREELSESRKRELALQKKERELVASLSHDLKTPVTGIKVTTELLKAKAGMAEGSGQNADLTEKLDLIEQKADQIDVLVSDLFSATLEDLGEFKVSCRDEASPVLHEIVAKCDSRELVMEEKVPDVIIRTDSKRMSQVIGNIIANSYKYAGTKIDVTYRIAGSFLEMKLRDHGPGVPAEELDLITNKFYRGKKWVDSKEDGSGLGLYIAKTLMDKMGGELIPESSGDGFCITLLIPLS
ncbi:MAG: HAMP domain-containing histidine kinase [Lachnospiraceae bacterium]|nr:HAMP domain-containing histidine kinase [Lachnospiraceae bacterium]